MDFLSWHNLLFYISIVFGLIVGLGSAFGGHGGEGDGDTDADGDVDQDIDGEADHDTDGEQDTSNAVEVVGQTSARRTSIGRVILRMLGVGKAPITVLLMTVCLLFGLIGIILNQLFVKIVPHSDLGLLSVALSLIVALVLTRFIAGAIHRLLPTFETYSITSKDLVGRMGTLILPADAKKGTAHVHDHEGNIHQIACRTDGSAIAKGTEVLIVQYMADSDTYLVERNPLKDEGENKC